MRDSLSYLDDLLVFIKVFPKGSKLTKRWSCCVSCNRSLELLNVCTLVFDWLMSSHVDNDDHAVHYLLYFIEFENSLTSSFKILYEI